MLFDKEVNSEFPSGFCYTLGWYGAYLRIHVIFLLKYIGIASMFFFFLKKKEKFNNSSYSYDQLNKLVL